MITKALIPFIIMFLYSFQKAEEQSIRMEKGGLSNPQLSFTHLKVSSFLQAKKLYGTYDLSDEPFAEPLRVLKNEFYQKYKNQNLSTPSVGEVEQL